MSKIYHKPPAELLGIEDEYTGFCLNEACMVIQIRMENGESPRFHRKYSSFSDLYNNYRR